MAPHFTAPLILIPIVLLVYGGACALSSGCSRFGAKDDTRVVFFCVVIGAFTPCAVQYVICF
jgi:hypothetical protein